MESTPGSPRETVETCPRDAAYWAAYVATLHVAEVPPGAISMNVEGHPLAGPFQGFGPLWIKTYRSRLNGVSPAEVIRIWKARFPEFQPRQNRFFPSLQGIVPGQVVLLNASVSGLPVDAGVMVLYADDESFTLITPKGLPESGWLTFSASRDDSCTVAQVQSIARSSDPLYELGFRLIGARQQEHIWRSVLASLSAHFGAVGQVQMQKACLDPRCQWRQSGNVWSNAMIRSMAYVTLMRTRGSVRWLAQRVQRR